MKALILSLVGLLVPAIAHADQCEAIDNDVADKAIAALKNLPNVLEYCEPCGDTAPGAPHKLEHVAKQGDVQAYFSVTLDKREVDLAYTYVETAPGHYENLAKLSGCATSGVSPSLTVEQATDTGVLITSSAPAQVHEAQAVQTIIVHEQPNLWPIIAACMGSTVVWAGLLLIVVRRRKVIAMRPRAIDMVDRE